MEKLAAEIVDLFQSTLPRGERPYKLRSGFACHEISILAPTRGATMTYMFQCSLGLFQSTLPRGERPEKPGMLAWTRTISIHAPTRGATAPSDPCRSLPAVFQSTLPRGERLQIDNNEQIEREFQSTLPRGERLRWET